MGRNARKIDSLSYLAGFLSAVFFFLVLFGGSFLMFLNRGVTIYLDSEDIARVVRDKVITQARQDLPKLIEGAKADIPRIVEEEMQNQLTSDRMEIAGFVFRIPDELLDQLRKNMQDNVEKATGEILDGIDTIVVAEQFGEDVYIVIRETIHRELDGQSFTIMAFDRIPVRIRVRVLS